MRSSSVLLVVALGALSGACGDDDASLNTTPATSSTTTPPSTDVPPTSVPATDDIVLIYDTVGGCQMMGPNCPKYVLYSDGTVEIFRSGESAPAELTGTIEPAAVQAWLDTAETVDLEAMIARLPPGTCQSCVDGADITLDVKLDGEFVRFDSTIVSFELAEPFFAALDALMNSVRAVGELPVVQR